MHDKNDGSGANILSPRAHTDVPITDLSHLYGELDPRAYYRALGALDYRTPDYVQQLARWCLKRRSRGPLDEWIIDIGCGYGVNGAGLLYNVPVHDLLERYADEHMAALPSEVVIAQDTAYFSSCDREAICLAGLDVSRASLDYGQRTGLIDMGVEDDLTEVAPPNNLVQIMQSGPLIIESGVPIFIAPHVIHVLLASANVNNRPWVITAPPRYTNVAVYEDVMDRHGYSMAKVSETPLPHRRFVSVEEGERIIRQQVEMGVDSSAEENSGYIHVDLYLARPNEDSEQVLDFTPTVRALAHP